MVFNARKTKIDSTRTGWSVRWSKAASPASSCCLISRHKSSSTKVKHNLSTKINIKMHTYLWSCRLSVLKSPITTNLLLLCSNGRRICGEIRIKKDTDNVVFASIVWGNHKKYTTKEVQSLLIQYHR